MKLKGKTFSVVKCFGLHDTSSTALRSEVHSEQVVSIMRGEEEYHLWQRRRLL